IFFDNSSYLPYLVLFFFHPPATTQIYTLSLHDALPISARPRRNVSQPGLPGRPRIDRGEIPRRGSGGDDHVGVFRHRRRRRGWRSEEHTSELQSLRHLVCRLLLEKKKKK